MGAAAGRGVDHLSASPSRLPPPPRCARPSPRPCGAAAPPAPPASAPARRPGGRPDQPVGLGLDGARAPPAAGTPAARRGRWCRSRRPGGTRAWPPRGAAGTPPKEVLPVVLLHVIEAARPSRSRPDDGRPAAGSARRPDEVEERSVHLDDVGHRDAAQRAVVRRVPRPPGGRRSGRRTGAHLPVVRRAPRRRWLEVRQVGSER